MAVSDTMVIDLRRAEAVRGGLEWLSFGWAAESGKERKQEEGRNKKKQMQKKDQEVRGRPWGIRRFRRPPVVRPFVPSWPNPVREPSVNRSSNQTLRRVGSRHMMSWESVLREGNRLFFWSGPFMMQTSRDSTTLSPRCPTTIRSSNQGYATRAASPGIGSEAREGRT